jgi:hypothetical protein
MAPLALLLAWASERLGPAWPRWVSLAVLAGHLALLLAIWAQAMSELWADGEGWPISYQRPLETPVGGIAGWLLMLGFFVVFAWYLAFRLPSTAGFEPPLTVPCRWSPLAPPERQRGQARRVG